MNEYAVALVSVAMIAAVSSFVSYDGGEDKGRKFAVSAILLYTALCPLAAMIGALGDLEFPELPPSYDVGSGAYGEISEEAFTIGIEKLISERFDIPEDDVSVSTVGFDVKKMKADYIYVRISAAESGVDYRSVGSYIEEAGLGICEVTYSFD